MASIKEAISAAFSHVFTDENTFIQALASEYTIANMGQRLEDLVDPKAKPERLFVWAYGRLASNCDCEGVDVTDEYEYWVKEARKLVAALKKAKQPFTLVNAKTAFESGATKK